MDLRASVAARPAAVAAARALAILRFVDFEGPAVEVGAGQGLHGDRKSTRLNSSHDQISYAVFCLKKKMQHDSDQPRRSPWTVRTLSTARPSRTVEPSGLRLFTAAGGNRADSDCAPASGSAERIF